MSFRHKALYGQSGMGKTWLLKRQAALLRKHKQKVIVYSGVGDLNFAGGCKTTMSADQLEEWLAHPDNYKSFVMLDEGKILFYQIKEKTHPNIYHLFMSGRHKGYTAYIATQYPTSIPPIVRVNCAETFCFRLGNQKSAKIVWEDNDCIDYGNEPLWSEILKLEKLQCFHIRQPQQVKLLQI